MSEHKAKIESRRPCGGWRSLIRSRSGATSLLFAASAVSLLGVLALGTEVGGWYLGKRQGQNAADAAAVAGALASADRLAGFAAESPQNAALAVAQQNGLIDGINGVTVTPHVPPTSGTHTRTKGAVEVIISQTVNPVLTGLFLKGAPIIQNRAVAALSASTSVCAVSFGPLAISGASFGASNCAIASDSGISVSGSPGAPTLLSVGTCSGCTAPFHQYQSPVTNFFEALGTTPMSDFFTPSSCTASLPAAVGGTITLPDPSGYPNNVVAYCDPGGLNVSSGTTLALSPGTYVLAAMNLNFSGGTVSCAGCDMTSGAGVTIVMTGVTSGSYDPSTTGTISISNTTVTVNAPQASGTSALFDGVLLYRDSGAGDAACNSVSIALTSDSNMAGAMYFPNSCASYTSPPLTTQTCTAIYATTLSFPGEATFDDRMCGTPGTGTRVPVYHTVDLLE